MIKSGVRKFVKQANMKLAGVALLKISWGVSQYGRKGLGVLLGIPA